MKDLKKLLLLVGLALAAMLPAQAADYVLAYVNGGTTYYLARNGTSGVERVTTFDPTTCIWSCEDQYGYESTLNNSDTYGWLYQTVSGTKYYLSASTDNLTLVTGASKETGRDSRNYTMWRTNGTYMYNYYRYRSWGTNYTNSYYVNLASGVARNETANTASNARPYQVTTNNVAEAITGSLSTPTITPSEAQTVEYNGSVSYTASATGPTRIVPAHTTYTFNGTTHYYYNNQDYTSTDAFANNNPEVTYTWALSGAGASALELMSTTGENTIMKYTGSASGTTATLTVTATVGTATRTASVTINVTPVEPTAISATGTTVYVGNSGEVVYTLTPDYAYHRVNVASGDAGVFTVTSPATGGSVAITPVAAGQATLTLTALNSNGSNGPSTSVSVTVRDICAVPEFAFAQSGSDVEVTLTSATLGATIRYTTDGTDPTTESNVYSDPFTVADGTTIKAIAVKGEYYDASAVATKTVNPIDYVEQGVSGGIVTLNDLEDHRWTYYSGVSSDLDGGNYNTNYLGKLYSPNPRNVKITYKANGGAVSIDESETEFVYYKTLEESATSGEYAYQVISNPFSKRPNGQGFGGWKITSGADYIKDHSANDVLALDAKIVFNNLPYSSVNCISAEIVFEATWVTLNDITYASGNTITYNVSGGNYETNILVLNRNVTGTITTTSPVTIMMVEPDGSNDYRDDYTFTGNITPNNNGVTKIEFTRWNSSNTVDADFKHLWIGRGMTTTSQCANLITGTNSTTSVASPKYSIKLESGTYNFVSFYKGYYGATSNSVSAGFRVSGNAANAVIVYGNDYDRAKGDNNKLEITQQSTLGLNNGTYTGFTDRTNRDNLHTLDMTIKSGTIGSNYFIEKTNNAAYLQGGDYGIYLSCGGQSSNVGRRNVVVEGGDICSLGGGVDLWNNYATSGDGTNSTTNLGRTSLNLRIKGGIIHSNVYGGAAKSPAGGNRVIVMTGGTVKGWVAGGCNGISNDGGETYGASFIYIGGKGKVDSENSPKVLGYANGGNVYAAGAGMQGASSCGEMTFGTNLVIADDSYIERAAYGGGNYGYAKTTSSTNIYITGGTNGGGDDNVNSVISKGAVYGGSNRQDGPNVNIYMTGGEMQGGVYGGCNTQGTIDGDVTMQIDGGQVGTTTQHANIHGGGYGSATRVSGNVEITLGQSGQTTDGVTVYGDVYGGSALGHVNGTTANDTYHTYVTLNKGTINGSLYGGALGDGSTEANVYGSVKVKVYGGSVKATSVSGSGAVYGCNNVNGKPQRAVTVDIYGTDAHPGDGTYAINAVYGGGNQAPYTYGTPNVTVHNCTPSIGDVYGGGNAASVPSTNVKIYGGDIIGNVYAGGNGTGVAANFVMVTGTADAYIYGGKIKRVFPGNNSSGIISGTKTVHVDALATDSDSDPAVARSHCPLQLGALFGGGNQASGTRGVWDIVCTGSSSEGIDTLFGGANNANITDASYTMTVNKGNIRKAIYGGNNAGGTVQGDITLDVLAPTGGSASCYNAEAWPTVFGGGFGKATATGGNVTVNIGTESGYASIPTINGNVYGGSALGSVNGSISHTTTVNILNGHVTGHVFGGGLGHKTYDPDNKDANGVVIYDADSTVAIEKGNVVVNIGTASQTTYNDTYKGYNNVTIDGMVFGGNDSCGTPQGNVAVNIYHTAHTTASISPNQSTPVVTTAGEDAVLKVTSDNFALKAVYGGGNLAHYKASDKKATVHIYGCENTVEFVYGGGNAADVPECELTVEGGHFYMIFGGGNGEVSYLPGANITEGDATTNVYGGVFHSVFGGSNTKGVIKGDMKLTVDQSKGECGLEVIGNLYGGGNRAESKSGNLTVECGQIVLGNVYGGANMASVTGDVILTMKGGEVDSVFAGNNQSGVIGGNVTLILNGGTIRNAFGGNNAGGNILGSITVNVDSLSTLDSECLLKVDNVYGGGNKAAYTPTDATAETPEVNVKNGSVRNAVFGGGLGEAARVTANPIVKVGTKEGGNKAMVGGTKIDGGNGDGNVFGGGSQADVLKTGDNTGNTRVILTGNATVMGNVYGGGNQANVEGNSSVKFEE